MNFKIFAQIMGALENCYVFSDYQVKLGGSIDPGELDQITIDFTDKIIRLWGFNR